MYTHTYIHTCIHAYMCVYIYIYIYTCIDNDRELDEGCRDWTDPGGLARPPGAPGDLLV